MEQETLRIGGIELTLESGEIARQAAGSALLRSGDTLLLATVAADRRPTRLDYMPLTTEYRIRYSAAGRIPGGYERRESRPSDPETLTSRLIDRSVRPFFPSDWTFDTQLMVQPLSFDPASDVAALGITVASAALCLSDIPWRGPVAGIRIGRVDAELKVFPTPEELGRSDLDLVVSASRDGIVMVEGAAREASEDVVLAGFALAREAAAGLLDAISRLAERAGRRPLRVVVAARPNDERRELVRSLAAGPLEAALAIDEKLARHAASDAVAESVVAELEAKTEGGLRPEERLEVARLTDKLKKERIREGVLDGRRIGGRGPADIRAITGRVGWLARCHGSSLFTRGETQAIVTCTLGTAQDAKTTETLDGRQVERFLLHYNFPPYSVGEVKPLRGPGRREIGHGNLARRALAAVLPADEEIPYTVRLESLITESNGSSSMATVCGGSLALQDAGVKLLRPVAGIAMGLVKTGDRFVVLSDILGDEDHVGDMDFKVCGTTEGITAIQLDNKLGGLPDEVMRIALEQARAGRLHILTCMAGILGVPRVDLSPHAPRASVVRIEPNRIGGLVGAGGKTIKGLQEEFSVSIDIGQDGTVRIYGKGAEAMRKAEARVLDLAGIPRLGERYDGSVVGVQPFGSFVRLFEGIEGLLPDVSLELNSRVAVVVTGVNPRGRLVLKRV